MNAVRWLSGGLLATLMLLSGCSALKPKLEAPRLMITHVAMTSADIFSQQFLVRVTVTNPNDREFNIRGLDYKLFLEGDAFAEGVSNAPIKLPAMGEKEFDMTVRTNFMSSIGRLVSRLNGRTKASYVVEGTALTDIRFFKKVPFRESGTVDLTFVK